MKSKLYYESHVTIEPVFDERLQQFKELCRPFNFRVADLLMKKRATDTEKRSSKDSFCTSRDVDYDTISNNTRNLVLSLQESGFQVWRYKIEDTLLDSKIQDEFGLIT